MNNKEFPDSRKYQALKDILSSNEFKSADKYRNLLEYLFEASVQNKSIKESTIAVDCLGKDSTFDPSIDSSVRVYLSKLRKKLEHYYLTEGIRDEIELYVPKGQYYIQFRSPLRSYRKSYLNWKTFAVLGFVLISVAVVSYTLGINSKNNAVETIPDYDIIWKDILSNEKKTLIVLGDYYFFALPYLNDRQSYIRDVEINSQQDLENLIISNPELKNKITPIYHTYLEEHIPWCVSLIIPSFVANSSNYELKLASEVQLDDLNKYNLVYIGPYKTLSILTAIVGKLNFSYEVKQGSSRLNFKDIVTNESYSFDWITNPETQARNDYAMVIKVKGPNDNSFLFFLSEHDFGNISTVKYFTNLKKISEFEEKLTSNYFEALFEVEGIVRTDFNMKLLKVNQLQSNFSIDISSNTDINNLQFVDGN